MDAEPAAGLEQGGLPHWRGERFPDVAARSMYRTRSRHGMKRKFRPIIPLARRVDIRRGKRYSGLDVNKKDNRKGRKEREEMVWEGYGMETGSYREHEYGIIFQKEREPGNP